MSFFRQARAVLGDALGHLNDDDGWAMASHVALSALMAVFPFLIFVAALAGFIGEADLASRVAALLFDTWPKDVAEPIADDVQSVLTQPPERPPHRLGGDHHLPRLERRRGGRTALNRAYRVRETRSFLFLRAQSLLFVVAGAVASLVFAFLGVLGPIIFDWVARYVPEIAPFATTFLFVRLIVTGLMLAVVLVSAHLWLPAGRPPAPSLWPGIIITLTLWLIAAFVFGYYLQRFANYAAYYAGLASVVTAIFFMYLVALIMIFGAEFNAALARRREP